MKSLEQSITLSTKLPSKQAWAKYLRNRFPENAVGHTQTEFDLSEGRARGAVFGSITQATIDLIRAHPRGGLGVTMTVEAIALGITLDELLAQFISDQIKEAARERRKHEEREIRLASLRSRIPTLHDLAFGRPAEQDGRPVLLAGRADRAVRNDDAQQDHAGGAD